MRRKHRSNQGSHLPGCVDLGLKSRSQKLGGGVGGLRRVRRVFFCCIVGVRVLTTDIVGEAAGTGVVVSNDAGVGVVVGNAAGVGGITAAIFEAPVAAAGTCWGVGLFAIPNTIATTAEKIPTIPTPIAALLSLTTGIYNTAVDSFSLLSLTDGTFCTGVGAGTLLGNSANENTATGIRALLSNATGGFNTAGGAFAPF